MNAFLHPDRVWLTTATEVVESCGAIWHDCKENGLGDPRVVRVAGRAYEDAVHAIWYMDELLQKKPTIFHSKSKIRSEIANLKPVLTKRVDALIVATTPLKDAHGRR